MELFDRIDPAITAVICGDEEITYGQLWSRARAVASTVEDSHPDEKAIGVRCGNRIEFAELVLGVLMSGRDAVLIPDFIPDFVSGIMQAFVGFETIIGPDDTFVDSGFVPNSVGTIIFMTSGTTGLPKLVRFPSGLFETKFEEEAEFLGISHGTKVYFPGAALLTTTMMFQLGATLIIEPEKPTPEVVASSIRRYGAEMFFTSPSLLDKCIASGVLDSDIPTLRAISSSASRLSVGAEKWCMDNSHRFTSFDTYTSGESGAICFTNISEQKFLIGPGLEVELRDVEDGVGQIYFRGRDAASGFFEGGPMRKTDGWVTNGDYCRFTEDGKGIQVVARANGKVKKAGFTVYPFLVERVLVQEGIAKDAMISVSRGDQQDSISALVVSERTEAEIKEALTQVLPRFCVPDSVETVDFIDRSPVEGGRMGNAGRY